MNIGIVIGKTNIDSSVITRLTSLIEEHGARVYFLCDSAMGTFGSCLPIEEFYQSMQTVIVLGGDGTLLRVSQSASQYGIPVLGINFGRVGLLADLEQDEIELVRHLFTGEYSIDERMMLTASVTDETGEKYHFTALNEIALSRGNFAKMLEMNLYIDGALCTPIRADGLIVSTPTGSTAYSMSAGGAVIDPLAEAFAVTPICPHTVTIRPMVICKNRTITIKQKAGTENVSFLSYDGNEAVTINPGMEITVKLSEHTTKLIRIVNRNFYSVLKDKL